MEPLFFKAENDVFFYFTGSTPTGFNGAAFFQSGKSVPSWRWFAPKIGLQWSRFFSKRKIQGLRRAGKVPKRLQWSRFFSKRKIRVKESVLVTIPVLQWSRFFSKRKIR